MLNSGEIIPVLDDLEDYFSGSEYVEREDAIEVLTILQHEFDGGSLSHPNKGFEQEPRTSPHRAEREEAQQRLLEVSWAIADGNSEVGWAACAHLREITRRIFRT